MYKLKTSESSNRITRLSCFGGCPFMSGVVVTTARWLKTSQNKHLKCCLCWFLYAILVVTTSESISSSCESFNKFWLCVAGDLALAAVNENAWRQDRWESMTYNRSANTSLGVRDYQLCLFTSWLCKSGCLIGGISTCLGHLGILWCQQARVALTERHCMRRLSSSLGCHRSLVLAQRLWWYQTEVAILNPFCFQSHLDPFSAVVGLAEHLYKPLKVPA